MRISRAIALAAAVALSAAAPAAAQDPIQPGDYIETAVACTGSFIFDGTGAQAGKVFMSTAAHCVQQVGQSVRDEFNRNFGTVAVLGNEADTEQDWALIQIRPEFHSLVRPALKGHPTVPRTGYTVSAETRTGDEIVFSGYGIGYSLTSVTRERRPVRLTFDNRDIWGAAGALINGDSGGPLVHGPTGKALGIESRVCIDICTDEGPTVEGMVARAAAAGFPIAIRTVS